MLTTAVCSSQVAVESRLHGLTSGRVFDTKPVKTVAWAIAKVQYGESIAAARALVAANLSLPTAWASGAQVQRVGEGGQGGYCGWRVKKIECCKTSARIEEKKDERLDAWVRQIKKTVTLTTKGNGMKQPRKSAFRTKEVQKQNKNNR